ncbi:MAG: tRNA 2-thiouridine(34) synthase MnmA [Phycisphaerales bacterium]|nr:MAG: tRNA 2-thiouridine(34) synthase MnmA [Phycisphaerales bacterium]
MAVGEKVVIAMSGGVDSSVSACLLHEQGYEVVGLFMRSGTQMPEPACNTDAGTPPGARRPCCGASDAADARSVAGMLGISFYALNCQESFDEIINYFADEYARGRTPNPCIICNAKLKFGTLLDYADAVGARSVATGHYARVETREGRKVLCRSADRSKDQSYALFGLEPEMLERVMFPVGGLSKPEVRAAAARFNLPVAGKPDSAEICFAPDRDYAQVVRQRRPDAFAAGRVVDGSGNVMGQHRGLPHYTIGQRRGLGIAAGRPIYVTGIDAESNTVTVGDADALLCAVLEADRTRFLVDTPETFRANAKIRYLHRDAPATIERTSACTVRVTFDQPQRAVTPGQAVVFYDRDVVLGGGWIVRGCKA